MVLWALRDGHVLVKGRGPYHCSILHTIRCFKYWEHASRITVNKLYSTGQCNFPTTNNCPIPSTPLSATRAAHYFTASPGGSSLVGNGCPTPQPKPRYCSPPTSEGHTLECLQDPSNFLQVSPPPPSAVLPCSPLSRQPVLRKDHRYPLQDYCLNYKTSSLHSLYLRHRTIHKTQV